MGDFNRRKKFGGDRDRGRNFGNRGRREDRHTEMYQTVCDECGNKCEVPFRPTGDKPVYCSDCFRKKGNNNQRESNNRGGRDFGRKNNKPHFSNKQQQNSVSINYTVQFEQINSKLDKLIKLLTPDIQDVVSEEKKEIKSKKFKKQPKKEVETKILKKVIKKVIGKKETVKKVSTKKTTTKKPAAKKTSEKKVAKKKPATKKVAKKTTAKKTVKKAVTKKKK